MAEGTALAEAADERVPSRGRLGCRAAAAVGPEHDVEHGAPEDDGLIRPLKAR